jgi:hypothetical protein
MIAPIAQNICNIWVAGALSGIGTISLQSWDECQPDVYDHASSGDSHAGAFAMKTPHGMPSRSWESSMIGRDLAK